MTTLDIINKLFSLAAIAGQLCIFAALIYFVFFKKKRHPVVSFIQKHGLLLAFLIALSSVLGSLFYSQIAGFAPCDLCWIQRIFMYPLVVLLIVAFIKKDSHITDYLLSLSVIGFLISLYHNYMYYDNGGLAAFCQLGGAQVSCIKRYVFEFGYITIPMMSATAFLLIIGCLIFYKQRHADDKN